MTMTRGKLHKRPGDGLHHKPPQTEREDKPARPPFVTQGPRSEMPRADYEREKRAWLRHDLGIRVR
jgi:hypothetical protein